MGARQRGHDLRQSLDFAVAEAARLLGLHRGDMHGAIGEDQRKCDVIGRALRTQILQHQRVARGVLRQPMADHRGGRDRGVQRARLEFLAVGKGEVGLAGLDTASAPPDEAAAEHVRMQRADKHAHPPKRNSGGHEPLADLGQHLLALKGRASAIDQPVDDVLQTIRGQKFQALSVRCGCYIPQPAGGLRHLLTSGCVENFKPRQS